MEILNLTGATLFNKSQIIDHIIEVADVALDDKEELEILDKIERFLPKAGEMSTELMTLCARQIRDLVKELGQTHALVDVSPDYFDVLKRTAGWQDITILSKDDLTVV